MGVGGQHASGMSQNGALALDMAFEANDYADVTAWSISAMCPYVARNVAGKNQVIRQSWPNFLQNMAVRRMNDGINETSACFSSLASHEEMATSDFESILVTYHDQARKAWRFPLCPVLSQEPQFVTYETRHRSGNLNPALHRPRSWDSASRSVIVDPYLS
jgi:hypothetical protein